METRQPINVQSVQRVIKQKSAADPHGTRAVVTDEAVGAVDTGRKFLFHFLTRQMRFTSTEGVQCN